jgi:hypothetical protein
MNNLLDLTRTRNCTSQSVSQYGRQVSRLHLSAILIQGICRIQVRILFNPYDFKNETWSFHVVEGIHNDNKKFCDYHGLLLMIFPRRISSVGADSLPELYYLFFLLIQVQGPFNKYRDWFQ